MKDNIYVGMIGLGTVGGGVAKYFQEKLPSRISLKTVAVRNLYKERDVKFPNLTTNPNDILDDPEIDIVVELMGGENPAKEYILKGIERGKSIVTANKVVISKYAKEIFEAARRKGVDVKFEASVGGGIQIIHTLERLRSDNISTIMGILNGTTNYILTRVSEGLEYNSALRLAQERGFAEADPELDVSGKDARDKLAILASLVYNVNINPQEIYCEGITEITPQDMDYARELEDGYVIKLLAVAKRSSDKLELRVQPALINQRHPLATVRDEFNAIYLEGDMCGPQMYLGRGAGREATTSAVISDIACIADNIRKEITDDLPTLNSSIELLNKDDFRTRGYIRADLKDVVGTLEKVAGTLRKNEISIREVRQWGESIFKIDEEPFVHCVITTYPAENRRIQTTLEELCKLDCVHGKPFFLRIEQ
ncbi:MAG: homoserine dehydrogenase [Candidatus Aenigmarchaeota archaeon]|nr:homoserine dehydrogenase [Candidatus Aenigmarchaeota archaeon]